MERKINAVSLFFLARTKRRNARLPSEEKDVRVSAVKVGNNFFTFFFVEMSTMVFNKPVASLFNFRDQGRR